MAHVVHGSHPEIVKRLKRAEGHLGDTGMLEAGPTCLDLAQQPRCRKSRVRRQENPDPRPSITAWPTPRRECGRSAPAP